MRAVVQRAKKGSVSIRGEVVGEIGPGLVVLLGVGKGDNDADVAWMADKVAHLRIFEGEDGKLSRSVLNGSKDILVVSQFTLYADTSKGRRPSFTEACESTAAKHWYEHFCQKLSDLGAQVKRGVFAAEMEVSLVNQGPVTIWLDSRG